MGWLYTAKPDNVKEFFRKQLTWRNEEAGQSCKPLDLAIVNMRTLYGAIERTSDTGEREVFAIVFLLNFTRDPYYNFGYKDMDESMGPNERQCPERILKLLTPLKYMGYAEQWRKDCWETVQTRKERAAKRKVGVKLHSKDPAGVKLGRHGTYTDMEVVDLNHGAGKKRPVLWVPQVGAFQIKDWVLDKMEIRG